MTANEEQHGQLDTGYPHTLRPELHKALKDAGIDFWMAQGLTFWNCKDGRECVAYGYQSYDGPRLAIKIVGLTTPEQAIAATLGTGTCHIDVQNGDWYCNACGEMVGTCDCESELFIDGNAVDLWKYCPNCGRKVVDE